METAKDYQADFRDRLQWVVDTLFNGNVTAFASEMGLQQSQCRKYLLGTYPRPNVFARFDERGISRNWLQAGVGNWWASNAAGEDMHSLLVSLVAPKSNVKETGNQTLFGSRTTAYKSQPIAGSTSEPQSNPYLIIGDRDRSLPISVIRASASTRNPLESSFETWADLSKIYPPGSVLYEVSGRCMSPAGIDPGDLAVIVPLQGRQPREGEIVLAYTDDGPVLKRYIVRDGKIYLTPDDSKYPEIEVEDDVYIQGVLHHTMRQPK